MKRRDIESALLEIRDRILQHEDGHRMTAFVSGAVTAILLGWLAVLTMAVVNDRERDPQRTEARP